MLALGGTSEYNPAAHHARAFTNPSGAFYKDQVCHGALRRVLGIHAVHVHWVSAAIGALADPKNPNVVLAALGNAAGITTAGKGSLKRPLS